MLKKFWTSKFLKLSNYRIVLKNIAKPSFFHHHYFLRFNFSTQTKFTPSPESSEIYDTIKKILYDNEINCKGCGVKIQFLNDIEEGYIPKNKLMHILSHNQKVKNNVFVDEGVILNEVEDFDPIKIELRNKTEQELLTRMKRMDKKKLSKENVAVNIDDIELLEQINGAKLQQRHDAYQKVKQSKSKDIICMRCHKLKHYSEYNEDIKTKTTCI